MSHVIQQVTLPETDYQSTKFETKLEVSYTVIEYYGGRTIEVVVVDEHGTGGSDTLGDVQDYSLDGMIELIHEYQMICEAIKEYDKAVEHIISLAQIYERSKLL